MIKNASKTPLNVSNSSLPNMASVLDAWLVKLSMGIVTKSVVNFKTVETVEHVEFMGVWQQAGTVLNEDQYNQKVFSKYTVHTKTDLSLKVDDTITYRDRRYRVNSPTDNLEYGYFVYTLTEDFKTTGPY